MHKYTQMCLWPCAKRKTNGHSIEQNNKRPTNAQQIVSIHKRTNPMYIDSGRTCTASILTFIFYLSVSVWLIARKWKFLNKYAENMWAENRISRNRFIMDLVFVAPAASVSHYLLDWTVRYFSSIQSITALGHFD